MPIARPARPTAPLDRRAVLRALAVLPTLVGASGLKAAGNGGAELRVVVSALGEATSQIVAALTKRLPGAQVSEDIKALVARGGPAVYLAVGPAALEAALNADVAGPLVSAFVSSAAYLRLTAAAPRRTRPVTAVFAEASPAAQMQLIRRLYRRKVVVGVLLAASTRSLQPQIERAASAADLAVSFEVVEPGASPVRALAALTSANVLLAVPDPDLYNAQVARAVLESTYRRRQGVIGFSKAMVGAGTLAAAYATIDDVVVQLGEMLDALLAGQAATEPQYPLYWRVAVNDTVARSLDMVIDTGVRSLGNFPA